jgi:hypothetical protein
LTKEIVNYIKHGRVLFIYGNDEEYIEESVYLSKLAPIFEGKPQNIVELEKPKEAPKVVATSSTTSLASTSPVIANTTVPNPDEKNISIMLDVIKQEAEYKQYSSLRKKENYIDYLSIIKSIIVDKSNLTATKHNEKTATTLNLDSSKKGKEEKIETTTENQSQNVEEIKKDVTKQEEVKKEEIKTEKIKKEEPKKDKVKNVNRKYSEEAVRKSLGLGVKLK